MRLPNNKWLKELPEGDLEYSAVREFTDAYSTFLKQCLRDENLVPFYKDITARSIERYRRSTFNGYNKWAWINFYRINNIPFANINPWYIGIRTHSGIYFTNAQTATITPLFADELFRGTWLDPEANRPRTTRAGIGTSYNMQQGIGRPERIVSSTLQTTGHDTNRNLIVLSGSRRALESKINSSDGGNSRLYFMHHHPAVFFQLEFLHSVWEIYLKSNPIVFKYIERFLLSGQISTSIYYHFFHAFTRDENLYYVITSRLKRLWSVASDQFIETMKKESLYQLVS